MEQVAGDRQRWRPRRPNIRGRVEQPACGSGQRARVLRGVRSRRALRFVEDFNLNCFSKCMFRINSVLRLVVNSRCSLIVNHILV